MLISLEFSLKLWSLSELRYGRGTDTPLLNQSDDMAARNGADFIELATWQNMGTPGL